MSSKGFASASQTLHFASQRTFRSPPSATTTWATPMPRFARCYSVAFSVDCFILQHSPSLTLRVCMCYSSTRSSSPHNTCSILVVSIPSVSFLDLSDVHSTLASLVHMSLSTLVPRVSFDMCFTSFCVSSFVQLFVPHNFTHSSMWRSFLTRSSCRVHQSSFILQDSFFPLHSSLIRLSQAPVLVP